MSDQDNKPNSAESEEVFDLEGQMSEGSNLLGLSDEERFKVMLASGGGGSKVGPILTGSCCVGSILSSSGSAATGGSCT
ncbi:MAG: hypothetical protein CL675_09585 [Bdellovibrionaceae bacterium]|nr:hypothetical protein [Pseudobdellovibrionaceae bacterium]